MKRDEFMAALDAHEDIMAQLYATVGEPGASRAALLEAFRMSRRRVVAAFDQATLATSTHA